MTLKALKTLLLSLLCISVLSACGFHLRGSQQAPLSIERFTVIGDNRFDGVASELQRLATSHKILIDNNAPWRVRISDEKTDRWLASATQSYSRNEYWLSVSVEVYFSHEATEYRPITLKREALFQDNTDQLNSKAFENKLIIQELRQQLAEEILQRLSYLAANPPDCNCDEN